MESNFLRDGQKKHISALNSGSLVLLQSCLWDVFGTKCIRSAMEINHFATSCHFMQPCSTVKLVATLPPGPSIALSEHRPLDLVLQPSREVKQPESASSLVISNKWVDGSRSDDTVCFSDQLHIFWRLR